MSKTITIIELLNKIAKGEEVPKKIKYIDIIYEWDKKSKRYYKYDVDYIYITFDTNELNNEIEIIEDEEQIDIESIEGLLLDQLKEGKHTNADIYMLGLQINALIRAVKQINKKLEEK